MRIRGKNLFAFCCTIGLIFGLLSCSTDDGDNEISVSKSTATVQTFANGKIIKNKVVMLDGSSNVYYEYLTFTSETSGTYTLYKGTNAITSITNLEGETVTVPTSFTYEPTIGKFTAGETSSYLFNIVEDDKTLYVIASEIMTPIKSDQDFFAEWKNSSDLSFTFSKSGDVSVNKGDKIYKTTYTVDKSFVDVNKVSFCWTSTNSVNILYYMAYKTTTEEVTGVGKSLTVSNLLELQSSNFILFKR